MTKTVDAGPGVSVSPENDRYRAQRGSISQAAQRPDSVGRKKEREKREREGGNQLRHYAHSYAGDYAVEYAATTSHTVVLIVLIVMLMFVAVVFSPLSLCCCCWFARK